MSYSFRRAFEGVDIYGDGARSCIDRDPEFQAWLRANKDSLPDDIQAKINAGDLTIADAD
tara:strand:+ start:1039 stop:1218 length:180 start_codon:yes stop_codon:yes gene_type:complete